MAFLYRWPLGNVAIQNLFENGEWLSTVGHDTLASLGRVCHSVATTICQHCGVHS